MNKRISVTPIALIGGAACKTAQDFASIAGTLDRVAHEVGVNFIGGYSALVSKGMTEADKLLIESIPLALSTTDRVWARSTQNKTIPWAVPSWWYSVMRRMIIRLWQAPSTA